MQIIKLIIDDAIPQPASHYVRGLSRKLIY